MHFSDQCFHIGLQHWSSDDVCAVMKKNFSPQGFLLFSVFGTRWKNIGPSSLEASCLLLNRCILLAIWLSSSSSTSIGCFREMFCLLFFSEGVAEMTSMSVGAFPTCRYHTTQLCLVARMPQHIPQFFHPVSKLATAAVWTPSHF